MDFYVTSRTSLKEETNDLPETFMTGSLVDNRKATIRHEDRSIQEYTNVLNEHVWHNVVAYVRPHRLSFAMVVC